MTSTTINDLRTMPGGGDEGGTLLANRYSVVRQLGQGGMGSVWLVKDTQLDNKQFAIKMLPSILVNNKRAYRQLKDEALVAMKLTHPNIVTLRAFEENNSNPFLVMDYVDGQTLDDYLSEKGKLTEEETVRLLTPIASALDYAHGEGVVHRDVKPANVMIRKDGHPFILDFGIAREIQETMTRVTGKLSSGTLLYMSPEQLDGDPPKKEQDIYSFAAMAYECLKGEPPFVRGAIEDQIRNKRPVPLTGGSRSVAAAIMAGLAKKPEDRPPTCAAVLEERHPSPVPRPNGTGGKKLKKLYATLVVSILLAAFGFCGWHGWKKHEKAVERRTYLKLEEERQLNNEKARLRNKISDQFQSASNLYNQVEKYRKRPEGIKQHLEKIDSLWASLPSVASPDDVTLTQLTNALTSVSTAVAGIQSQIHWLAENKNLRDEIFALQNNADTIRKDIENSEGDHWRDLPEYIKGTNSLETGSAKLDGGELESAKESMTAAINLLRKAYSDEQEFITFEKNRIVAMEESERIAREKEQDRIAYEKCLEQIAALHKDASNEYAKIVAIRDESFASGLVDSIETHWAQLKNCERPKTLAEANGVVDDIKGHATSIKCHVEDLLRRKDDYLTSVLAKAHHCRMLKKWQECILNCDIVLKIDRHNSRALTIKSEALENLSQEEDTKLLIEDIAIIAKRKDYDEKNSRYTYAGNATMTLGVLSLSADKVIIITGNVGDVTLIVARGRVRIRSGELEAGASDHVGMDIIQGKVLLKGDAYLKRKNERGQRGRKIIFDFDFIGNAKQNNKTTK